jgi:virginiamycin B lyase
MNDTQAKSLSRAGLAAMVAAGLTTIAAPASAADLLLSGTIASASGEKMNGVTVSAKAEGSVTTTTVYTDEAGEYYFPALPAGKYQVWAQAVSFETAKGDVDLSAARRQDFKLSPLTDANRQVRQLPGDMIYAALPEETAQDARMKTLVKNNCTGCHTLSYILQHRFDEDGWYKVLELMKNVNVSGVNVAHERKVNAVLERNQKELAAYLARARGPGESSMKVKLRPRPSGEAARVVFTEYDVPLEESSPNKRPLPDGSDWTQGSPSKFNELIHDAYSDFEGNLWFTVNTPNYQATVGKVDTKTGQTKLFKVAAQRGFAANAHGIVRDDKGILWFNANTGRGSLGRVDPKTEKIDVYVPPQNMSQTGGAVTIDADPQGKIWVTAPDGALHFDPETEKFTEFKSPTFKSPTNGANGITYGLAADKDGNGWWLQMALDTVNKGDVKTGKTTEIKLPPVKAALDLINDPELVKFYEGFAPLDFNTPVPWNQGPRRMGADKNADVVWVGTSWGASLIRINTKTMESTVVPLPHQGMSPYQITVDKNHNLWMNVWTSDVVLKYEPATGKWTTFDLPSRGTEVRHISIDERDGKLKVIIPEYRVSKMAVMNFRSEADIAALKAQAAR